jgi:hypothetical protein
MRRPVTAAAISLRLLMRMTFVAALTPFAAFGHHSAAPYDFTREVEFEGTVTKLEWQNPHILFTLETRGADGNATLQEIEVVPVSLARTWGLPREALAPGEHVVVKAWTMAASTHSTCRRGSRRARVTPSGHPSPRRPSSPSPA